MNGIKSVKQAFAKFAGTPVDVKTFVAGFTGPTEDVWRMAAHIKRDAAETVEKFNRIFGDAEETAKGGE